MQPMQPGAPPKKSNAVVIVVVIVVVVMLVLLFAGVLVTMAGAGFATYMTRARAVPSLTASTPSAPAPSPSGK